MTREFAGLALGLERAAAYIATERVSFARYLSVLNSRRAPALGWSNPILTGSDSTVATIWANSVARLTPQSRRLLDRLAMLTPAPIPDALMDVAVPGEAVDYDAYKARAGLFAYSLIARANSEFWRDAGLRNPSPSAGFRPRHDEQRAKRRGAARDRGLGSSGAREVVPHFGSPNDAQATFISNLIQSGPARKNGRNGRRVLAHTPAPC